MLLLLFEFGFNISCKPVFFPKDLLLFCLNLTESSYEDHVIMSCIQKSYLVHLFQKKH